MSSEGSRQKFVTDTLSSMIQASHKASHNDPNCSLCSSAGTPAANTNRTSERRYVERINSHLRVIGETSAGRFETNLLDLSDCGAFLGSVLAFPRGTTLTLKFKLDSDRIVVPAEVCYCIEHVGFGVRFVDLKEDDRKRIDQFLARRAGR